MLIMLHKQTKKNLLLQAGLDIFYEKGFECTTIDDIVGRATCGKGTFYRYFQSKEALFDELENSFKELLGNELEINCPDHLPVKDYLTETIRTVVKVFKMHQKLGLIKFARDQKLRGQKHETCSKQNMPSILHLENFLNKSIAAKNIRKLNVEAMTALVVGAAHFYLFRAFKLGIPFTEGELEDTVEIILNGVLPS